MDEQQENTGIDQSYKPFIGVKLIEAYPCDNDTLPGYNVKYPDGYESWSPKDVFEAAYLPISVPNSMVQQDINKLYATNMVMSMDDGKTTLVKTELVTGFTLFETAACVDPKNYDEAKGADIAMGKANSKLWFAMGFLLQWAKYGLKNTAKLQPSDMVKQ